MPGGTAQVPKQPALHRSEAQVVLMSGLAGCRFVLDQPVDFAGAEVGIQQETRAGSPLLFQTLLFPSITEIGRATVLPDQRWAAGLPIAAAPKNGGLALIGDAAGDDSTALLWGQGLLQTAHRQSLALPDGHGVLFHPAISGVLDRQGSGGTGDRTSTFVIERGPGTTGALIQCQQEWRCSHAGIVLHVLAGGRWSCTGA